MEPTKKVVLNFVEIMHIPESIDYLLKMDPLIYLPTMITYFNTSTSFSFSKLKADILYGNLKCRLFLRSTNDVRFAFSIMGIRISSWVQRSWDLMFCRPVKIIVSIKVKKDSYRQLIYLRKIRHYDAGKTQNCKKFTVLVILLL